MDATYIDLTIRLSLALLLGGGFAVWIRSGSEGFLACGGAGGFGHRIPGRRNDYLPEECGAWSYYGGWLVGDGGHRIGVRYGNVCCSGSYHGDGAAGTGGAELLDSAIGNHYR